MVRYQISVVIPYHNKWSRTKYLLESLNRQTMDHKLFEVLFIDDGSDIPLENHLRDFKTNFHYQVIRTQNQGRSCARNEGLRQASSDIVLFLDDDIILSPTLLEGHYKEHVKLDQVFVHGIIYDLKELTLYENPESGELYEFIESKRSKRMIEKDLLNFEKVFGHWEEFTSRKRLSRLEKLIVSILNDPQKSKLQWIACVGGNLSVSRKILLSLGGFDENFQVWGGEDFELGYRLVEKGLYAVNAQDCYVYHITHAHMDLVRERNLSKEYFINKHKDKYIVQLYDFLDKKRVDM